MNKKRQTNEINAGDLDQTQEVFTEKEAAAFLRISAVTLWRERAKGKITFRRSASKLVYTREDLFDYLERNKREAFAVKS